MSTERWKYKQAIATAGDNRQTVREITAGERNKFVELNKKVKAGEMSQVELGRELVTWGCVNPALSEEDVNAMPTDLFDACATKILELSGLNKDETEKKAPEVQH